MYTSVRGPVCNICFLDCWRYERVAFIWGSAFSRCFENETLEASGSFFASGSWYPFEIQEMAVGPLFLLVADITCVWTV